MRFDAAEIARRLPHRQPFMMLDAVEDVVPATSGTGIKVVSVADPVFAGHFPGRPIYPGVLLVEAIGHTAGLVESAAEEAGAAPRIGYLAGIRKCAFKHVVVPGDRVEIHVRKKVAVGRLYEYEARCTVAGRVVLEGAVSIASVSDQP